MRARAKAREAYFKAHPEKRATKRTKEGRLRQMAENLSRLFTVLHDWVRADGKTKGQRVDGGSAESAL